MLEFSSKILQFFTTSLFSLMWLSLHGTFLLSAREELPCVVSLVQFLEAIICSYKGITEYFV